MKYWSLSELAERLVYAEKKSEALERINEPDFSPSMTSAWGP